MVGPQQRRALATFRVAARVPGRVRVGRGRGGVRAAAARVHDSRAYAAGWRIKIDEFQVDGSGCFSGGLGVRVARLRVARAGELILITVWAMQLSVLFRVRKLEQFRSGRRFPPTGTCHSDTSLARRTRRRRSTRADASAQIWCVASFYFRTGNWTDVVFCLFTGVRRSNRIVSLRTRVDAVGCGL